MNDPNQHIPDSSPEDAMYLDADLLPLAAELDRLARIDGNTARAGLEDRLMQVTLAPLHGVQPVATQMAELGAIDRARAPSDLESDVFEGSVPALREAAAPRLVLHAGGERDSRTHVRVRRAWWMSAPVRMAALVALAVGTTFAIKSAYGPPKIDLSERVRGELDVLLTAVEPAIGNADAATDGDSDPDKLSEWLSEGASL